MTSIIDEIHGLQGQYFKTRLEHAAEREKYREHCHHRNVMGQQISLDRMTELGILELDLQRRLAELNRKRELDI
jgi:hypothetical protein